MSTAVLQYQKREFFTCVRRFCEQDSSLGDVPAFDLYFKLREFMKKTETDPHNSSLLGAAQLLGEDSTLSLSAIFYGFIVRFLKDTLAKVPQKVKEICAKDAMEPIAETSLYSPSVVQLFAQCKQAYIFLCSLEMGEATFLGQYAEIVCQTVRAYIDWLLDKYVNQNYNLCGGNPTEPKFRITKEVTFV